MDKRQPVHDGHRERMRERVLTSGIESLQPHEILEYLLYPFIPRRNTNDIAHALIEEFGSFYEVLNAEPSRLATVKGMTENAALYLCSLPDVFRRYSVDAARERTSLCGRGKAREYLRVQLYGKPVEQVYMAAVDVHDKLIKLVKLSSGSGDGVEVSVRTIVEFALSTKASGILLAHNHPSGRLEPSNEDYALTSEIFWTLDGIGVKLQDHYIFGADGCYSFEESGELSVMKEDKKTTLKDGTINYVIRH